VWWFLPSVFVGWECLSLFSCRGDYTGEEILFSTLVLPSVVFSGIVFVILLFACFVSGRIHRRGECNMYSRSPLSEPVYDILGGGDLVIHVGEIHMERSIFQLSFSLLWIDFWSILLGQFMWVIFVHFISTQFYDHFHTTSDTTVVGCLIGYPTMYIYSLRHFLTTKGALINGVWGFGLTPPKMSKND